MLLYIANGTHQNIDFQYRIPNMKSYRQQTIPIGGQQQLSGNLSKEVVEAIIESHQKYGICRADEIANFRGFFIPYVYSIDKPVSYETIAELVTQNRVVQTQLGVKIRREAALAVNSIIEENITGEKLNNLEMTIEEVSTKNKDPEIHEGVRITRSKERGAPQDARKNLF